MIQNNSSQNAKSNFHHQNHDNTSNHNDTLNNGMFMSPQVTSPHLNQFFRSNMMNPQGFLQQHPLNQTSPQQSFSMNPNLFLNQQHRFVLSPDIKIIQQTHQQQQILQKQQQQQIQGILENCTIQGFNNSSFSSAHSADHHFINNSSNIMNINTNTPNSTNTGTSDNSSTKLQPPIISTTQSKTTNSTNYTSTAPTKDVPTDWNSDTMLHYYIYDYLIKKNFNKTAHCFATEAQISCDAPLPIESNGGFLYEWWTLFWELYSAKQGRMSSRDCKSYLELQKNDQSNIIEDKIKTHTMELYYQSVQNLNKALRDTNKNRDNSKSSLPDATNTIMDSQDDKSNPNSMTQKKPDSINCSKNINMLCQFQNSSNLNGSHATSSLGFNSSPLQSSQRQSLKEKNSIDRNNMNNNMNQHSMGHSRSTKANQISQMSTNISNNASDLNLAKFSFAKNENSCLNHIQPLMVAPAAERTNNNSDVSLNNFSKSDLITSDSKFVTSAGTIDNSILALAAHDLKSTKPNSATTRQQIQVPSSHLSWAMHLIGVGGQNINTLNPLEVEHILQLVQNYQSSYEYENSLNIHNNQDSNIKTSSEPSSSTIENVSSPRNNRENSKASPATKDTSNFKCPPTKKAKYQKTKNKKDVNASSNTKSKTSSAFSSNQKFNNMPSAELAIPPPTTKASSEKGNKAQQQVNDINSHTDPTIAINHVGLRQPQSLFDDGTSMHINIGQTQISLLPEVQRDLIMKSSQVIDNLKSGRTLVDRTSPKNRQINTNVSRTNNQSSPTELVVASPVVNPIMFQSHTEQSLKLKESILDQLRCSDETKDDNSSMNSIKSYRMKADIEKSNHQPELDQKHRQQLQVIPEFVKTGSSPTKQEEVNLLQVIPNWFGNNLMEQNSISVSQKPDHIEANLNLDMFNFRDHIFQDLDTSRLENVGISELIYMPKSKVDSNFFILGTGADDSKFFDPQLINNSRENKQLVLNIRGMNIISQNFLNIHERMNICVFGANGRLLLSSGQDGIICLWDIQSSNVGQDLSRMEPVWKRDYGPTRFSSGKFSVFPASSNYSETHVMGICGSDGNVQVFRLKFNENQRWTAELGLKYHHSDSAISYMSFSPLPLMILNEDNSIRPCYWSASVDAEGHVKLWTVCSGNTLKSIKLDNACNPAGYSTRRLEFKPISTPLDMNNEPWVHLACSSSYSLYLYAIPILNNCTSLGDISEHVVKNTPHQKNIHSLQWNASGTVLLTSSEDTICLWGITGETPAHSQPRLLKSFSKDNIKFSCASIIEQSDSSNLFTKSPNTSASPQQTDPLSSIRILVGGYEQIYLWNPNTNSGSHNFEAIGSLNLMPSGHVNRISVGPEYSAESLNEYRQKSVIIAASSTAKSSNLSLMTFSSPSNPDKILL